MLYNSFILCLILYNIFLDLTIFFNNFNYTAFCLFIKLFKLIIEKAERYHVPLGFHITNIQK